MKKRRFLILFLFTILGGCLLNSLPLKYEGYFQGEYGSVYDSDEFKWNIWDANIYFENRFYSDPLPGTNAYLKFYSDKENGEYKSGDLPVAILTEGHISFRQEKNRVGLESVLFTRESGRYWLDSSLLELLDVDKVKDSDNGQGVRCDFWLKNTSLSNVISDFSSDSGDDVYLARLRQVLFKEKLRLGITYQRKNYSSGGKKEYNSVLAGDINVKISDYYLSYELSNSAVPSDQEIHDQLNEYRELDEWNSIFKQNFASKGELSGIKAGSNALGFVTFTPGAYFYGDCYRNYMGKENENKYGGWINSSYLIPKRAVTITCNYNYNRKIVPDTLMIVNEIEDSDEEFIKIESFDPETNLYTELYVEFINGFKWKLAFNKKDQKWRGYKYKHYDLFTELQVENRLAKLMTQFKIKDLGETEEIQIWGIETSVNLTDKWRFFSRGLLANDRSGSRISIFGEISYKIGGNTEAYFQYGSSEYGRYGLVNDDGFATGGNMKNEVKLIVRCWF